LNCGGRRYLCERDKSGLRVPVDSLNRRGYEGRKRRAPGRFESKWGNTDSGFSCKWFGRKAAVVGFTLFDSDGIAR